MSQLNIHLPEEVARRLRERAAGEGHKSVEAFVEWLLTAEAQTDRDFGAPDHLTISDEEQLEEFLRPRLEVDPEPIEFTPEFREQFMKELRERGKSRT